MQVEVEVKHIKTNFGGCGLSGFKDFAASKIWPNFPFGPWTTIQDNLLARVILILANLFVRTVRSNWRILYWRFELPCLSSRVSSWLYGHVHIVNNYWQI